MVWTWFWLWLVFVIVLLVIPLTYGWALRGWGPPYPSYYRRRGAAGREAAGDPDLGPAVEPVPDRETEEELAGWGILADFLWVFLIVAVIWLLFLLFL